MYGLIKLTKTESVAMGEAASQPEGERLSTRADSPKEVTSTERRDGG